MSNSVKELLLRKKLQILKELKLRKDRAKLFNNFWFNPNSLLSIDNYPKHKEFIRLSKDYRVRLFMGCNRGGKTILALFEASCHNLNWYPEWWNGDRFEHKKGENFSTWIVSDSFETSRDIIQSKLFYEDEGAEFGTGLLPYDSIIELKAKSGVANCYSYVRLKREGGGVATIFFKSSDAGRKKFQGTPQDLIIMDEEPPLEIYSECLLRTMTTRGRVDCYFTPLSGLTPMIEEFEKDRDNPEARKTCVSIDWWSCAHIDEEMIAEMTANTPEYLLEARSKGIPSLGAGAIYRYTEKHITCEPFAIPDYYDIWYGMDVGWKTTAAAFFAQDPNTGTIYMYDEMYVHEKEPHEYARLIKMRGKYIRGVIDPASMGANQHDGKSIFNLLTKEGLELTKANNDVEFGIQVVSEKLNFEKFKVFSSCASFLNEYRSYHRDEKGKIVKRKDHILDAVRYGIVSGEQVSRPKNFAPKQNKSNGFSSTGWLS